MSSLISADNTWALWAIMLGVAAISVTLEQKYNWASKISGCILCVAGMLILANVGVVPTDAPAYDSVWTYVVPLAIPLLLFQCNIKKIGKGTGRLLAIYLLSSVGTLVGGILAGKLLGAQIPEIKAVTAMFTGTYTGGSVNFAAMAEQFGQVGTPLASAAVVADNLLMVFYVFILIAIPTIGYFKNKFTHPIIDELEAGGGKDVNLAKEHWKAKPISLRDIVVCFAASTIIVTVSIAIAGFFKSVIPNTNVFLGIVGMLLGNKYLIMTTLTMILATIFEDFFGKLAGANELGTFLIYIFFAVIGAPASIPAIIHNSPILLVFAAIVVLCNTLFTFTFGRIFKFDLESCIIASNANIGGPTTAAAFAISKGWAELVGPAMLVGVLGYVLGNYLGIIASSIV